jgi:16S rRNA (cytosine1402-N4)-methyltransferase
MIEFKHIPVMIKGAIELLSVKPGGIYVDGTLGGGGHAQAMLGKSQITNHKSQIRIVGIDQDIEAINFAKKRLSRHVESLGMTRDRFISASIGIPKSVEARSGSARQVRNDLRPQVIFVHDNFRNLEAILDKLRIDKVDGILLDLGVSSYQLDSAERGFSFRSKCHSELDSESKKISDQVRNDILLDMRMDQRQRLAAVEVINSYSEEELSRIFFAYGEERFSRQIAREIVKRRREKQIKTANDLVSIIKSATPPGYRFSRHHHFASKIFRALRMEVNQELETLHQVLPQAVKRLKKGGRLVIISFHSLEDRIVKHFFREMKNEEIVEILTKKPLTPMSQEIRLNPRAQSAKLRAIEKI